MRRVRDMRVPATPSRLGILGREMSRARLDYLRKKWEVRRTCGSGCTAADWKEGGMCHGRGCMQFGREDKPFLWLDAQDVGGITVDGKSITGITARGTGDLKVEVNGEPQLWAANMPDDENPPREPTPPNPWDRWEMVALCLLGVAILWLLGRILYALLDGLNI